MMTNNDINKPTESVKRSRGRIKGSGDDKTERILFRCSLPVKQQLETQAKEHGRSLASEIFMILKEHLN